MNTAFPMLTAVDPAHMAAAWNGLHALDLEGELGAREMATLAEQLRVLTHAGVRGVVLDFSEVSHLDYRQVRPLVAQVEQMRHAGADVKLCALSPYLAAILRVSGAHDVFECFKDEQAARDSFAR